jgi:hypothetical protein
MSKRIPAADPPPRVIHYVQPSPPTATLVNPADIAAHRRDLQIHYHRWLTRQEAIQRRDRAVQRALLVIAIVIGVGLLTAGVMLGWIVYQAVTHPSHGTWLGLPADLLRIRAWLGDVHGLTAGSASPARVGK